MSKEFEYLGDGLVVSYEKPLRQQLAELKARNKQLLRLNEMSINFQSLIDKLKQQLKEKDEELKRVRRDKNICAENSQALNKERLRLEEQLKSNTKQVCEKIRNELPKYIYFFQEPDVPRVNVIEYSDCEYILDQIEKGEDGEE